MTDSALSYLNLSYYLHTITIIYPAQWIQRNVSRLKILDCRNFLSTSRHSSLSRLQTFTQWAVALSPLSEKMVFQLSCDPGLWFFYFISFQQRLLHRCLHSLYVNYWPYIPSSQSSFKTPATAIIPSALFNVYVLGCVSACDSICLFPIVTLVL